MEMNGHFHTKLQSAKGLVQLHPPFLFRFKKNWALGVADVVHFSGTSWPQLTSNQFG